MTLSTGKQKKNKNTINIASQRRRIRSILLPEKASGVTLVELMLVAAIILALVTIATPLLKRTYEDLNLSSSARTLGDIMQFCQERSVMERKRFRLEIDADKKSYKILAEDEESGEFRPLGTRWGRTFHIPGDIEVEADAEEVDFYPDGSATPLLLYLANKQGKSYTISVEHNTGMVKIYDYKKE